MDPNLNPCGKCKNGLQSNGLLDERGILLYYECLTCQLIDLKYRNRLKPKSKKETVDIYDKYVITVGNADKQIDSDSSEENLDIPCDKCNIHTDLCFHCNEKACAGDLGFPCDNCTYVSDLCFDCSEKVCTRLREKKW